MTEINASIDRLGLKIDGLGDKVDGLTVQVGTLGDKVDDLAVQVGTLTEGITRLERIVEALAADTKEQHEIARSQSENVAELIKLATALAVRG